MPKPTSKRALSTLDSLTTTPPTDLPPHHAIARIVSAQGKNLFTCTLPEGEHILCEIVPMLRGKAWIIRGGFVVVDLEGREEKEKGERRGGKIAGEIVNVCREVRGWKKMSWWPKEFAEEVKEESSDEDEEEDRRGMMPPSSDEEDY